MVEVDMAGTEALSEMERVVTPVMVTRRSTCRLGEQDMVALRYVNACLLSFQAVLTMLDSSDGPRVPPDTSKVVVGMMYGRRRYGMELWHRLSLIH
jgi:hypothetical protein